MRKLLTNNIGLKIISVICAFFLWIVVVNVDDPVITRVYSGITVDIINASAITDEGKTYEVADGSDVISVAVSAKRSVIERLTKDNIKATADMKNITFMNTVPIEIKTNRFSENIDTISSRNTNLIVTLEDKKDKQIKLSIVTEGKVADGHIAGNIVPVVDVIKVSGPESKVNDVSSAEISVDFSDMNESFTTSCSVVIYDTDGKVINDESITLSKSEIRASVEILETKEIPVTAYYTGTAASGFSATGIVICEPSSVVVAGKGTVFDNLSSVKIPDDVVSVDGAAENAKKVVNISEFLPKGIAFADSNYDGNINVEVVIEAHDTITVDVPLQNITVVNLPENYSAHIVYGEESVAFEISGLRENLENVSGSMVTAQIDAGTLVPKPAEGQEVDESAPLFAGANDGTVLLNLPAGLSQVSTSTLEVIINHHEASTDENNSGEQVAQ